MANFAHFPYEIIDQVFLHVLPADLENFAQTCRKVSSVAQPHLKAHRTMLRTFARVGNNVTGDGSPFGEVLFDILKNPLHAHYIINLYYRRCSNPGMYDPCRIKQDFGELVTLLPNLRTLTMEDVDVSGSGLQFQNAPFTDPPILTKLASVYVRFPKKSESESDPSFSITRALSTLPSLRLLSTQNCGFPDMISKFFAPVPSLLTRLELWDCCVQGKELKEFLRVFHQLQVFKHSNPFGPFPKRDYDPDLILSGLLYSKSTLQHLTLLAPGRSASSIGCLVEFDFLEEVYVSWSLLDPHWGSRDPCDLSLVLPKSLRLLRVQNEGGHCGSQYSRLAKCMVDEGGCAWNYSGLVESVLACKSSQTQSLSVLALHVGQHWRCSGETFSPLCQDLPVLQRRCIEMGIVLNIN